jgi:hypothetical protein
VKIIKFAFKQKTFDDLKNELASAHQAKLTEMM